MFGLDNKNEYVELKFLTYYVSQLSTRYGCSLTSYETLVLIGGCFNGSTSKFLKNIFLLYLLTLFLFLYMILY